MGSWGAGWEPQGGQGGQGTPGWSLSWGWLWRAGILPPGQSSSFGSCSRSRPPPNASPNTGKLLPLPLQESIKLEEEPNRP